MNLTSNSVVTTCRSGWYNPPNCTTPIQDLDDKAYGLVFTVFRGLFAVWSVLLAVVPLQFYLKTKCTARWTVVNYVRLSLLLSLFFVVAFLILDPHGLQRWDIPGSIRVIFASLPRVLMVQTELLVLFQLALIMTGPVIESTPQFWSRRTLRRGFLVSLALLWLVAVIGISLLAASNGDDYTVRWLSNAIFFGGLSLVQLGLTLFSMYFGVRLVLRIRDARRARLLDQVNSGNEEAARHNETQAKIVGRMVLVLVFWNILNISAVVINSGTGGPKTPLTFTVFFLVDRALELLFATFVLFFIVLSSAPPNMAGEGLTRRFPVFLQVLS